MMTGGDGPIESLDFGLWKKVMSVNVDSVFLGASEMGAASAHYPIVFVGDPESKSMAAAALLGLLMRSRLMRRAMAALMGGMAGVDRKSVV